MRGKRGSLSFSGGAQTAPDPLDPGTMQEDEGGDHFSLWRFPGSAEGPHPPPNTRCHRVVPHLQLGVKPVLYGQEEGGSKALVAPGPVRRPS